jgi:hypothetical protein
MSEVRLSEEQKDRLRSAAEISSLHLARATLRVFQELGCDFLVTGNEIDDALNAGNYVGRAGGSVRRLIDHLEDSLFQYSHRDDGE